MARSKIKTATIIAVKKPVTFAKSGWQYRVATAEVKDPNGPLATYRACIASALKDKYFRDYKAVREAFKNIAKECSRKVREQFKEHFAKKERRKEERARLLAQAI